LRKRGGCGGERVLERILFQIWGIIIYMPSDSGKKKREREENGEIAYETRGRKSE
jgi:hypothetical protein